jgi:hypothetical protein
MFPFLVLTGSETHQAGHFRMNYENRQGIQIWRWGLMLLCHWDKTVQFVHWLAAAEPPRSRGVAIQERYFPILHSIHRASYPVDTRGSFLWFIWPGCEANHSYERMCCRSRHVACSGVRESSECICAIFWSCFQLTVIKEKHLSILQEVTTTAVSKSGCSVFGTMRYKSQHQ